MGEMALPDNNRVLLSVITVDCAEQPVVCDCDKSGISLVTAVVWDQVVHILGRPVLLYCTFPLWVMCIVQYMWCQTKLIVIGSYHLGDFCISIVKNINIHDTIKTNRKWE